MRKAALIFCLVFCSSLALAGNGLLEINQTCATQTGCFPGDAAGFPVEITTPGSYLLTSNLDLSAHPDTIAISISSDGTSLNLGGFSIIGDITCTGSGATLSCPTGAGTGILASGVGANIHNGTVRNFSRFGIAGTGDGGRIHDVYVRHNGSVGISVTTEGIFNRVVVQENNSVGLNAGNQSVVMNSIAKGNAGNGFDLGARSVINGSTSYGNGGAGFVLSLESRYGQNNTSNFNVDPDLCGQGECTHLRRYYLTPVSVNADMVRQACIGGFRPAAAYELLQYNHLHFDRILADDGATLVGGPPTTITSWAHGTNQEGALDCNNWTETDMGSSGGSMRLNNTVDWGNAGETGSPWTFQLRPCSVDGPVWCIEND